MSTPQQILPDLLRPGLKLVFCGTAAGTVSAAQGAYYAGPGNRFWPMLATIGLTSRRFCPDEFALLLDCGIGLTDVAKTAFGPDAAIPVDAFDRTRLLAAMNSIQPGCLAFNGKKAASHALGRPTGQIRYGALPDISGWPPLVVLPSTSGAASGFWDPAPWFALAHRIAS